MSESKAPPERGSPQWKKNETIINRNPFLRKMRDQSEGISSSGASSNGWTPSDEYRDNYDRIFRKKPVDGDNT